MRENETCEPPRQKPTRAIGWVGFWTTNLEVTDMTDESNTNEDFEDLRDFIKRRFRCERWRD